jgi:hypothetical protein
VTRGTRPKKPSSSRDFALEARRARGGRGVWGFWGFWGLKTEDCKFLSFQAGNNYQKKEKRKIFLFLFFIFIFSSAHGQQTASSREGGGEGGRGEQRGRRDGGELVRADALASARTRVFYPHVTS